MQSNLANETHKNERVSKKEFGKKNIKIYYFVFKLLFIYNIVAHSFTITVVYLFTTLVWKFLQFIYSIHTQ